MKRKTTHFLRLLLCVLLHALATTAIAQTRPVTGRVVDSVGQAMPGVTVVAKGTQVGTQTTADGAFAFNVPESSTTLIFTMIGYKTTEANITAGGMTVRLNANTSALQDVVIVGYGTQRKVTVTGAIATVATKELLQSPVSNLTNALAGRLPGLITTQRSGEPGVDASTLYIRGIATTGTATPLIIVDGVERPIDYVDPNDIATFSILKDAASTAVFGMRGANGVVLVTTKRGNVGPPSVNFTMQGGYQEANKMPKYLNSYDYATLRNEAVRNDNPAASLPFSAEQLEGFKNGTLPNTNYYDFIMQASPQSSANLNISGGAPNVRYYISAGYSRYAGNYKYVKDNPEGNNTNSIQSRYTLRANVDVDVTKTTLVSIDLSGLFAARNAPNTSAATIMNLANRLPPTNPIFNPNGSLFGNGTYTQNIYGEVTNRGYQVYYNSTIQGTFATKQKLDFWVKGLSVRGAMSFDNTFQPVTTYGRNYAVFSPIYNASGQVTGYAQTGADTRIDPNGGLGYGEHRRRTYGEVSINYDRSFGKHAFTGMLMANRQKDVIQSRIPYAKQSLMARATYNYDLRYLFEVSAAYHGSENFPKGQRYGLFPAVSGGWVISEEDFLKGNRAISYLKLRGSYGEVGNDQGGGDRFLWFTSWAGATQYWFGPSASQANGWAQGAIGNPDVTWERGRKANVGIETKLWGELFGLTLDVFHERRSDILSGRNTLSDVFGQSVKQQNIGRVVNKGIDLEFSHEQRFGKFRYMIKPNVTFARNKILDYDEQPRAYPWMRRTGHPVGTKFGLLYDGLFVDQAEITRSAQQRFSGTVFPGDIKYKDLNGDNVVDAFDETVIGYSRTPEFMFGINLQTSWNGIDLTMLFQGADRTDVRLDNEAVYEFFQEGKVKPIHLNRWTPERASIATYPRLHYGKNENNHRASDYWVRSAAYMRLKNMEIGYTLPRAVTTRWKMKSARVYVNGTNLLTWDKLTDFDVDPEVGDGNAAMYPIQRVFNAGVYVTF
ncbi:TonB-dependent receptor [Chitinophaga horti]|uniref:TonB-dependent receptor n=1 Tax=Chitinophaga horti TaxID=2920382 RepID=A0ABY6IXV2_9BACT|nr:TonB-dependent receptor [Chitinophaga horti]UYQ92125.1 TonB-dependent receptor [Chitinophaga horti]